MSDDEKDKSAPPPEGSVPPETPPGGDPAGAAPGEPAPAETPRTAPEVPERPMPAAAEVSGAPPAPAAPERPRPAAAEGSAEPPAPEIPERPRPAAAEGSAAPPAPARPAPAPRAPAGPSPAELAQRAEVPSIPLARLRDRFSEIAGGATFFVGVPIVEVPLASLVEVCRFLKEDPEADCRYLSNLHGTHYPDREKPFEVVYNLYSVRKGHWMELKVAAGEGEEVPTVTGVWKTANWHEREAYDLLGIRFAGHPDLTRILLPDDWKGHPLRKEYPLEGNEGDHRYYR